jgi:hypothetical protein
MRTFVTLAFMLSACVASAVDDRARADRDDLASSLAGKYLSDTAPTANNSDHRVSELFCHGGDWFSIGGPAIDRGRYTIEGERICVTQSAGEPHCRLITRTGPGQVSSRSTARDASQSASVTLFIHEGPTDICPQR